MSADKELYHLVRKYKYFYKKLEDLKEFNLKYHDVDLSKEINQTQERLEDIQINMIKKCMGSLDIYVKNASMEVDNRFYYCADANVCLMSNSSRNLWKLFNDMVYHFEVKG